MFQYFCIAVLLSKSKKNAQFVRFFQWKNLETIILTYWQKYMKKRRKKKLTSESHHRGLPSWLSNKRTRLSTKQLFTLSPSIISMLILLNTKFYYQQLFFFFFRQYGHQCLSHSVFHVSLVLTKSVCETRIFQ